MTNLTPEQIISRLRNYVEPTNAIGVEAIDAAIALIERRIKHDADRNTERDKKKGWCLCGVGLAGSGHTGFCTAYYCPNHPNLVPPTMTKE